jgi:hypothetical protein
MTARSDDALESIATSMLELRDEVRALRADLHLITTALRSMAATSRRRTDPHEPPRSPLTR